MYEIEQSSSIREMLNFLRGAARNQLIAVCTIINRSGDFSVPMVGTKEQMIMGLRGVPKNHLWEAIDAVFPTSSDCGDDELNDADEEKDDDDEDFDEESLEDEDEE